jgi:hypothetical protein
MRVTSIRGTRKADMTKREMIDEILSINLSAEPQFLARFDDDELSAYLTHLRVLSTPRLTGNADRYEKYFRNLPRIAGSRPQWRCDSEHAEETPIDEQADSFAQAGPAGVAHPADAPLDPAPEPAAAADAQADAPAAAREECPAGPEQAPRADQPAGTAYGHETAVAPDTRGQELVSQDVDLAVGQAEREQLLGPPANPADAATEDDESDQTSMEAPFNIATSPRRSATTRATASTAARHMLYGADAPQPPPRPRRRAKSRAPAVVVAAPKTDQSGLDDLDDEKWPY